MPVSGVPSTCKVECFPDGTQLGTDQQSRGSTAGMLGAPREMKLETAGGGGPKNYAKKSAHGISRDVHGRSLFAGSEDSVVGSAEAELDVATAVVCSETFRRAKRG